MKDIKGKLFKGKCPDKNCSEHEETQNHKPECPECGKPLKVEEIKTSVVVCDGCGNALKEGQTIYIISMAEVAQNDGEVWDYEREEDDSVWCLDCGGKLPEPK